MTCIKTAADWPAVDEWVDLMSNMMNSLNISSPRVILKNETAANNTLYCNASHIVPDQGSLIPPKNTYGRKEFAEPGTLKRTAAKIRLYRQRLKQVFFY